MGNICLQPRPSTLLGDINKAKNAGTGKGKKAQPRDDTPQVQITPPPQQAPASQPARSPTPPPKPSIPATPVKTEEKKTQPDPGPSAPSTVSPAPTDPTIDDLTASYRNDDLVVQRAAQKVKVLEQMFDADRDHGYMDKDRLRFMLEKLKIMDKDVHNYLLKRYDQDYNGKVDFQEFCAMMLDVIDIKKSFEKADLDRNGSISRDEIGLVLSRLGITLEGHTITLLIDLFDNNRNGVVDFAEFFPMSFYLQELIKEYENFKTRRSGDTEWLRPLLGTHPNEEDAVAKQLRTLISDNNFPTMDEFARVIISAANSDRGQNFSTIKAPYVLKVRTKAHPSSKPKQVAREPSQSGNTERPAFSGLFEDPDFVPSEDLLPQSKKPKEIVWKRISEINPDKHELFVDGVEEGDVIQGSLGDCWFLGALAVVAASANEFIKDMFEIELPEQGYYRVKFFKDGRWVSVEIDDRLPCYLSKGGSLILYCASCRDESEFWVPLVEKAYAKLHGSYTALEGGNICDALKDLTGGAIEILRWKESEREGIWNKIRALSKDHSLMGCSIDSSSAAESKTGGGLLVNHAYSILKCKEVDGVRFVRIRNPWGEGEWTGDWSDQSPLWDNEWKSKKFAKKYKFEDDGTFFMSFEDFVSYFNRIYVMRSSYKEAKSIQQGEWKKGLTSFGCKNNPFWLSNPQYAIKTEERNTKVFVNLSQPDLRYSLKKNPEEYRSMQREYESVGLYILRTTEPRFKKMVYHDEDKKGSTPFTDMRDISFEFECEVPGTYILLPCTYHADKEASYFVSFYSKEPFEVLELPPKKSSTLNGEWSGPSAGGCSNYRATWMNNPQFLLKCSASDSIDIILAQSNAKGLQPIGIYVFAAFSDERMSRPSRVIEKPSGMPDEASVSATVHVDANESYIIMPTTLDPADGNFALTVISENITTFRLL